MESYTLDKDITRSVVLTGCGWITPFAGGTIGEVLSVARNIDPNPPPEGEFSSVPGSILAQAISVPLECQRDRQAWLAAAAIESACADARLSLDRLRGTDVGLAIGCGLAGLLGMIDFANDVRDQSALFVSPIRFPQTVGNYPAGAIARGFGIRGPSVTLAAGVASSAEAILVGAEMLLSGSAAIVLAGGAETYSSAIAQGMRRTGASPSECACFFVLERGNSPRAASRPPLALLNPGDDRGADHPVDVVSTAGFARPGAVFIQHWLGDTLGAAAASALAAAVGAVHGMPVPWATDFPSPAVQVRAVEQPTSPLPGRKPASARVVVGLDETNSVTVNARVPSPTSA